MSEYIKREAALMKLMQDGCSAKNLQSISDIPAADVAPVVRCKDCKYYKESRVLAPNKFCFRLNHPTEPRKIGYNFGDDDFCSYGEPKEGTTHD